MRSLWKRLLTGMIALALIATGLPIQQVLAAENSETYLLNYLVIEKPYIETPDVQNIVVSIGGEEAVYQNPVLVYRNQETNEVFECAADTIDGNIALFAINHEQKEEAVYVLTEIQFEAEGRERTITFDECGMNTRYGVNMEAGTSEANAVIVSEESVGLDITVTDAEGNTISNDTFGEALNRAETEAAVAPNAMRVQNKTGEKQTKQREAKNSSLVVVIDPGHDNRHSGCSYHGVNEQDLTLKIARYCKEELEKYYGVEVYLTRETEECAWGNVTTADCLNNRANFAEEKGADVFVSIHLNADDGSGKAYGAEVYYPNPNYRPDISEEGAGLAEAILEKLGNLGITKRGIQYQYVSDNDPKYNLPDGSRGDKYAVIRECKKKGIPGLIVEHAFLSNAGDYNNFLSSDENLKKLGVADATGIAEYYGLQGELAYKWTVLGASSTKIGESAQLYYAVNKSSSVTVEIFYGNNDYLKTLELNKRVGTNDQVAVWDLTDANGDYVENGTYRFTITARDEDGGVVTAHRWFQVSGNEPITYKWTVLGSERVAIEGNAQLYYAVNKNASITVQIFYGNNNYLKTLVSDKKVGTNDQVAVWDMKDANGNYVENGTYRFTITAQEKNGTKVIAHRWFRVTGNEPLAYKWTTLETGSVRIGESANFYYAVNKSASVTVQVFYGNNNYLKTLIVDKKVGTNDQVAIWDLRDADGDYVENGTYRFTITAQDSNGTKVITHKWFQVTGGQDFAYKWTNLDTTKVEGGQNINLYYAVNKKATISVEVFYGNDNFLKTLVSKQKVGTNDQVISWDLKDADGKYVPAGQYRFTITAVGTSGKQLVTHKYFMVSNYSIMGTSSTTIEKMAAYYKDRYTYPAFYANTEAPTVEDFCRIYMEECNAEGVRVEVAFCQSMKETGFLQYPGVSCVVKPEQYNFAGLDTTGAIYEDGTVDVGRSYPDVRTGIRAHVQRLKAYAAKGTTPESFAYECIDSDKYTNWWVNTIVGSAPYVEWLGKEQNPSGFGWATDPEYGYSIKKDYLVKLLSY